MPEDLIGALTGSFIENDRSSLPVSLSSKNTSPLWFATTRPEGINTGSETIGAFVSKGVFQLDDPLYLLIAYMFPSREAA